MTNKIYNVFSPSQLANEKWNLSGWASLGKAAATSTFTPLTLKALYITEIILASCQSVSILLNKENPTSITYYPAYAVFGAAIDILGRCIRGNTSDVGNSEDVKVGFKWLAAPTVKDYEKVAENQILVKTLNYEYPISVLVALRHFSAHGQAINKQSEFEFDYLLLGKMPPLIARGMEAYLSELKLHESLCINLAKASITPYRIRPLFDIILKYKMDYETFPMEVAQTIRNLDWAYKESTMWKSLGT